jgi:hypothetical protein
LLQTISKGLEVPDLTDYLNAVTVADSVSTITGNTQDAFVAGGYAAFVQALTGAMPTVVQNGNKASVLLTQEQAGAIRGWMENQLVSFLKPKKSNLDIQVGPVVTPLLLKYILPFAVLLVAGGWFAHWYWNK